MGFFDVKRCGRFDLNHDGKRDWIERDMEHEYMCNLAHEARRNGIDDFRGISDEYFCAMHEVSEHGDEF